jgi:protein-S-isoprenylcysteine O-methyltransferase Ste14
MLGDRKSISVTAHDLIRTKRLQMFLLPVRIMVAISLLAAVAGGPRRFFYELPGQVFSCLLVIQIIFERVFMSPDLGGSRKDRGSLVIAFSGLALTCMASVVDWYWLRPHWSLLPFNWIWVVVGASLYAGGMTFRLVAIISLGKFFTGSVRIHDGHEMIQSGPYRLVRHPAYLGLVVLTIGGITIFASLFGYLCFFLLFLPGLMQRIRVEEEVLTDEFGDGYREYCKRTKRLVPFIY